LATVKEITAQILKLQFLPNSPITDRNVSQVIATFEDALSDIPVEMLEAGVQQYMSSEIFFPSPGALRNTCMDLIMLAMGIPTAGEAWGMILDANCWQDAEYCQEGMRLRNAALKSGDNYIPFMKEAIVHAGKCDICKPRHYEEQYAHPVVAETVRLLGGREALFTDNLAADRAKFVDAYRERVTLERKKIAMLPEVKEFVQQRQNLLVDGKIKQLTKGMAK